MRKAKIVCTIGPASHSREILDRLIESGMNVARLNFSHGTHDFHAAAIAAIRAAADRRRIPVAIMQDLQGPRIRVGGLPDNGVELMTGHAVRLLVSRGQSGEPNSLLPDPSSLSSIQDIPVAYEALTRDVQPGARILINDGLIELRAAHISDSYVTCTVVSGGKVFSHKGINLPDTSIRTPTLTDKDREDLQFGIAQGVDYIALSFVRGPEDIVEARALAAQYGGSQGIIAKIERPEGVANLDTILAQADGVMIARGDLGVEMGPEAVPILQKRIIAEANRRRRLVITATQMLESMTQSLRPTRAEASDVANAVFDGTDAVMLSGETSIGAHPIESLQVMDRLIRAAEGEIECDVILKRATDMEQLPFPEAICAAASAAAKAIAASAVVAFSEQGTTARLISKQRPRAPIVAFTPSESVKRRMALYWGVCPYVMEEISHTDARVEEAGRRLKAEGLSKAGEKIVILSGSRLGQPGGTNLLKLHEVR